MIKNTVNQCIISLLAGQALLVEERDLAHDSATYGEVVHDLIFHYVPHCATSVSLCRHCYMFAYKTLCNVHCLIGFNFSTIPVFIPPLRYI